MLRTDLGSPGSLNQGVANKVANFRYSSRI